VPIDRVMCLTLFLIWAYLLRTALRRFRETDDAKDVKFTVKYFPYQLYPEASKEGEDKFEWYKKTRYGESQDRMKAVGR
jgi:hypothetical protein